MRFFSKQRTLQNPAERQLSSTLFGGTQYRVRLYPPLGYSMLYKEYYLTRFNHPKTLLNCWKESRSVILLKMVSEALSSTILNFGYCPDPVTVYIRGPIKGYISPYYTYYPTVTEGGQYTA